MRAGVSVVFWALNHRFPLGVTLMMRTTSRHPQFLRGRALVVAFVSFAGSLLGSAAEAQSVVLDTGVVQTPSSGPTTVATMPQAAGGGLSFTLTPGPPPLNLGSFDIVIVPSAALSANVPALNAFNRAAQLWESFISDPITVTINADFSALGPGILGSTGAVYLNASYNTVRNQLVTDAGDEPDDAIVLSMPTAAQFTATVPAGFGLDGNIFATKANLKAMGFSGLDGSFGVSDGNIAFSTLFTFDFDKTNGISPGSIDFEGVATHEIGHLLGFVSAVDDVDFVLPGTTNQLEPAPIDLFRFRNASANDPATAANFTTFARDMVPGSVDIFDQVLPGQGGDLEVLMSTGLDFGDGQQASHWKDGLGLGIMDPTASFGETLVLRPNDIRAMDLIGYEIQVVPEAGSLSLLLVGATLTLLGSRRSK
jgi:hypothetical protein